MNKPFDIDETQKDEDTENELENVFRDLTLEGTGYLWANDEILFTARKENRIAGRLTCTVAFNWMYLVFLHVEEQYRNMGVGKALLAQAEEKARERNLVGLHLNTGSWEAPTYYERLGYERYAELPDFPPGFSRYSYRKLL